MQAKLPQAVQGVWMCKFNLKNTARSLWVCGLRFDFPEFLICCSQDCPFGTFSKRSLLDLDFDLERSRDRSLLTPHKWGVILKASLSWFRIYIILGICDLQVKSYDHLKPTMLKTYSAAMHSPIQGVINHKFLYLYFKLS
jgi:hypothetical protein